MASIKKVLKKMTTEDGGELKRVYNIHEIKTEALEIKAKYQCSFFRAKQVVRRLAH